jgi:hypothetical protein
VTSEQYRRNGAECLKLAQLVGNPADKMLLLHGNGDASQNGSILPIAFTYRQPPREIVWAVD